MTSYSSKPKPFEMLTQTAYNQAHYCMTILQFRRLLLITNRKSYTGFRLAPNSMTLNDLKRQKGFFGIFLAILGCDRNLYHSQGGATLLSLCDPDREFGICI